MKAELQTLLYSAPNSADYPPEEPSSVVAATPEKPGPVPAPDPEEDEDRTVSARRTGIPRSEHDSAPYETLPEISKRDALAEETSDGRDEEKETAEDPGTDSVNETEFPEEYGSGERGEDEDRDEEEENEEPSDADSETKDTAILWIILLVILFICLLAYAIGR